MPDPASDDPPDLALRSEQYFVRALGGFVLGIAGGELVTHERVPLPRFNFVQVREVSPGRRTAFFERVLDHYFQRALRPTFRVSEPVPAHVESSLSRLGFRPREERLSLLVAESSTAGPPDRFEVRPARDDEFDSLLSLWTGEKDRPELRTALDVVWHHPNPDERLTPFVTVLGGRLVSGGLLYEYRGAAGLHLVTTTPDQRGQGAASALVSGVFARRDGRAAPYGFLFAESPRLESRLRSLGFRVARSFTVYELPADAELALPPVGPSGPPRWRPPRGAAGEPPAPARG